MKFRNYTYLLLAGTIGFTSCKKSFLEEAPPTAVAVNSSIKTESDMADAVSGMYNAMRQSSLYGRDIPVIGDVLADNGYVHITNTGRYLQEQQYSFINSNAEASNIWTQGYYAILQANRIIYAANTQFTASTANLNQLKGEAFIARALNYLMMENYFAPAYTVSPNADGVPLVTSPLNATTTSPLTTKPSRSSATTVYNKIISDLDSAYAIMPATPAVHGGSSFYLTKYAAKAIEARAYLYKGDYANAAAAAKVVIDGGGYTEAPAASLTSYWANAAGVTNKVETIFELSLNLTTNNGFDALANIYNQTGYGDIFAYDTFYASYSATDVRKALFVAGPSTKPGWVVNKYNNVSSSLDRDDIKIIRYSEVLLTYAEALARTGDDATALIALNNFVKLRDPAQVYASAGTQLVADILNERRKELAFEGLRYLDLQRTNADVVRPTQANTAPTVQTIPAGNFRRILPIPQSETDANPNIKQNPGY